MAADRPSAKKPLRNGMKILKVAAAPSDRAVPVEVADEPVAQAILFVSPFASSVPCVLDRVADNRTIRAVGQVFLIGVVRIEREATAQPARYLHLRRMEILVGAPIDVGDVAVNRKRPEVLIERHRAWERLVQISNERKLLADGSDIG